MGQSFFVLRSCESIGDLNPQNCTNEETGISESTKTLQATISATNRCKKLGYNTRAVSTRRISCGSLLTVQPKRSRGLNIC